jgi:2',3'-cyclic-nucleotide 2'-phosphodiesterase (5'-nucleotidase family)
MPRLVHYSDVENVFDEPTRAGRLVGRLRGLNGPDATVVGTGDTTAPGVLALVDRGRHALSFLSAADVELETFGNHDFDFGPDAIRGIVADADGTTWVSANVHPDPDPDREGVDGDVDDPPTDGGRAVFGAAEGVVPTTVREVDGARVGFVGVTDPATGSLNPMAAGLRFTDPVTAVRDAVDTLHAADEGGDAVDYVVVLSHVGADDDDIARVDGVDAVLGGHVHARRIEYVGDAVCTRPGAGGDAVVELDLATGEARLHEVADAPVVPEVVTALDGRIEAAGLDEPLGETATPLVRDDATVTAGECAIGNLVADAYRWGADADVGLQNSGGIRNGPPLSGTVTLADAVSVLPFEEPMVVAEVTGAELRAVFRQCAETDVTFGEPGWWHGHVSGAELRFEADRLVDARVGGEAIDADRTYTVATAEYLLHSDHEFPALRTRHRAGEFGIEYEVFADYVRERGLDVDLGRIHRA